MERVEIRRVQDDDEPPGMILELVARDISPVVGVLHQVGLVMLDMGSPRVQ